MTHQGGGDGSDPYELDPFGGDEYDPSVAFSYVSSKQAAELVREAGSYYDHAVEAYGEHKNPVSRSAHKSAERLMQELRERQSEVELSHQEAVRILEQGERESVGFGQAVEDSIRAFEAVRELHERVIHVASQMAELDPDVSAKPQAPPPTIVDPQTARGQVLAQMRSWLQSRGGTNGDVLVTRTTPGVGKTFAMMQLAYDEHMAGKKVIFSVRTKETIIPKDGETYKRLISKSPTGSVRLHVLYGRDETNCYRPEAVQLAMDHGYAPGPTVCSRCEHFPDNYRMMGFSMCPYYEARVAANRDAQAAKRGWNRQYPLILTTHATVIAAMQIEGGRWGGGLKGPDLIFIDEDPTDAMEVDVILNEEQVHFISQSVDTKAAGMLSSVLTQAIEIGKQEREKVRDKGFRSGKGQPVNSHPIHTHYDSAYTGLDHHSLLNEATAKVSRTGMKVPGLSQLLRDVSDGGGFVAQAGELMIAKSANDINAMDIPPKGLMLIAQAVADEIRHSYRVRGLVYEQVHGPISGTREGIVSLLEEHTDIKPLSYASRLECLPADPDKGRDHDEWRFAARVFRPLANTSANIIIGDAYAQVDHYEQLLKRPVSTLPVVAHLNPEATITRLLDSRANITELRNGELGRVLALIESILVGSTQPGDRILVYGHNELRPKVERWMEEVVKPKFGIDTWAYEHWWGGRGKDHYNGWEFVICLSDPILSVSGIKHVANARAFHDAINAKKREEILLHSMRCDIGDCRNGLVRGLRESHWRIALEHDRMNVAELTQAIHRPRPVNNPTIALTIGEMEMEPELLAQTQTVVPSEYRKAVVSASASERESKKGAQASRVQGTLDAFVTVQEAIDAIRAIVAHYGVYSPWFAHALVTAVSVNPVSRIKAQQAATSRMTGQRLIKGPIDAAPSYENDPPNPPGVGTFPAPKVPGVGPDLGARVLRAGSALGGAAEPAGPPADALAALPNPATLVERVWHPPVYWQRLIERASLPRAIDRAQRVISKELPSHKTNQWPTWVGKGMMRGRKYPWVVYDPKLLKLDGALRVYYGIVDQQYGPVRGGKLWRPEAEMQVPLSMSAIPF